VGGGVSALAPGDRVMAMTHFPDGAGGVRRACGGRRWPGRAGQPCGLVC
jgi:hypothetical protein